MKFNKIKKKIGVMFACGAVTFSGLGGIAAVPTISYAATTIDSSSGTINITGFASNLKSFQLYNYNASSVEYNGRTYRTGALIAIIPVKEDGTASISGLPEGVYRVKEYKTTTGYSTNKTYYTIKVAEDAIGDNIVPDRPETASGMIRLTGASGIPLTGMEFKLRNIGASSIIYNGEVINVGETVGIFVSDAASFDIKSLPYGIYELTQTKSTKGYHMDTSVYTINIVNGEPVEITVQVSNHQHMWNGGEITVAPTCTETGIMTYTCTVCDGQRTEIIDKLGHNYFTKEPTCQEDGYRKCTRCDDYMVLPKIDHDWDNGILTNHAGNSCEGNATRLYSCKYCGIQKTVVLPNTIGHSYKSSLTKASPTQDGGIIKTCTKCGYVQTDMVIAKIDHIELAYSEASYTGSTLKPSVKAYDANGKLIPSSYYTVNYYNNIKVGTASVRVEFKGNYSGVITENFAILPGGTSILSLTPLYHGFTVKWAMQTKETTGYELEYATKEDFSDAGILQTTKYTTLAKTVAGLKPDTKYYVRIRTYKGASYSAWSAVKTVTTKK